MSRLEQLSFPPVGVRTIKDANYGLDKQTYSVWICGRGSIDPTIPVGIDLSFVGRFHKFEKAEKEAIKLNKFLKQYKD
ncbi:hypothetical protein ACKS9G_001963 [Cronobacter turicensis]